MTFNPDSNIGSGKVSRRGRNTGMAVGGGGIVVVILALVSPMLGVDLSPLERHPLPVACRVRAV